MDKRFVVWSVLVAALVVCGYLATTIVAGHKVTIRVPLRRVLWHVPMPLATTTLATSSALIATSTAPATMKTILVAGHSLRVTVVDTQALREKGLGGRSSLAPNEGMLFAFPKDGLYAFWMKDMKFSIDMIWLSQSGSIVYMAQNVSPDTYPQAFAPTVMARYVLEVSAGYASTHRLKVGDTVSL